MARQLDSRDEVEVKTVYEFRRAVGIAAESKRRVKERVIDISGHGLAMIPHEAECMIRRRAGIGDVVVRHVDLEGTGPWFRSSRLYPLSAYRAVGLHRPPLAPCRLLVYQNLHGPRATSRKPRVPLRASGRFCAAPASPTAAGRRLVALGRIPARRAILVVVMHLIAPPGLPSSAISRANPLHQPSQPWQHIGSLAASVVASHAAMRPPFLRSADAVYALKMRMQLCRRHRCGRVKGHVAQSPLRPGLWYKLPVKAHVALEPPSFRQTLTAPLAPPVTTLLLWCGQVVCAALERRGPVLGRPGRLLICTARRPD
ncbi:hypothetical protein PSPO01_02727 [Paraphaeosphaeria sporulosa]